MMFASTGDERFRERVNYIVDELDLCQQAHGDGYVAAIPEGHKVFGEIALVVTYWGSDAGARVFDIIVDGKVIATQRLQRNKPGQFFDVTYPIPIELTKGKERVTVRFQAHPKCIAGGVFGVRMVRAKAQ